MHAAARKSAAAVLVLSIVGYPLIAVVSQYLQIENRLVSIPFRAVVLLLALATLFVFATRRQKHTIHWFWIIWWAFWSLYLLRMVVDFFFNPDVLKVPLWEYLFYGIGVSMLPALALGYRDNGAVSDATLRWTAVLGALGLVCNLAVIFYQRDFTALLDFLADRAETDTLNPIAIGHLGATIIILTLWAYLARKSGGLLSTLLLFGCCLVGIGGVIAGASRGPVLSLALVTPLLLFGMGIRGVTFGGVVAVAAVVVASQLGAIDFGALYLLDRLSGAAFQDSLRSQLLAQGLDVILSNPLGGGGTEPLETYPHNLVVESFLVLGVTTGLSFCFLLGYSLFAGLRLLLLDRSRSWIVLLLIQYASAGMVSGALYISSSLWVLMAAVVSQQLVAMDANRRARQMPATLDTAQPGRP
jgi:hypothetical protein